MRKVLSILILLSLIIIVFLSSCSLFPSEIERHLFFDSICWEDDSHILMYTMVRKWVNTTGLSITGESGYWDWSQGEIWRIDVFTGEKELLLRREGDYYTGLSSPIKIDILGDKKLISLDGNAYIMEGESADWQEIPDIDEAEWVNENEIIGISEETGDIVKYDLEEDQIIDYLFSAEVNRLTYDNSLDKLIYSTSDNVKIYESNTNVMTLNDNDTVKVNNINVGIVWSFSISYIQKDGNISIGCAFSLADSNYNSSDFHLLLYNQEYECIDYICIDDNRIIPSVDNKYFAVADPLSNYIKFYDAEKNIISEVKFPIDQLD